MKVLLMQDVEKLGKEGEVINVKDGYARNFLLPEKLAMFANQEALRQVERKKKKRETEEKNKKIQAEELAKKIKELSLTISVEAGVEDKIFGTITNEMIKNSLKNEGFEVDKKQILFDEQISKLGVYQIKVSLHPEVTGDLRVWVVKK